nr:MAG TPA: hypothetical protein [Crassvirales sp.]
MHLLQIGCSYHISALHVNPLKVYAALYSGYRNCRLHSVFSYPKLLLCKYNSWNRIYWLVTVFGYITVYDLSR